MKISRQLLDEAVNEKIINVSQAESLFHFLKNKSDELPGFNFTHIIYYFGGILAIGAMTLFMNLGWENFGGGHSYLMHSVCSFRFVLNQRFAQKKFTHPGRDLCDVRNLPNAACYLWIASSDGMVAG